MESRIVTDLQHWLRASGFEATIAVRVKATWPRHRWRITTIWLSVTITARDGDRALSNRLLKECRDLAGINIDRGDSLFLTILPLPSEKSPGTEPTSQVIQALVRQELSRFRVVPDAADELAPLLTGPELTKLCWDYGEDGEMRDCWIVAQLPNGLAIGYSQNGFSWPYFWGIVDPSSLSFGGDSSWFASLEDCFLQTGLWQGQLPSGYEVS